VLPYEKGSSYVLLWGAVGQLPSSLS